MNRRTFSASVLGLLGTLGLVKAVKASTENPKGLPVVRFDKDYKILNVDEIFAGIPLTINNNHQKIPNETRFKRTTRCWVKKDNLCQNSLYDSSFWGEVNIWEYKDAFNKFQTHYFCIYDSENSFKVRAIRSYCLYQKELS